MHPVEGLVARDPPKPCLDESSIKMQSLIDDLFRDGEKRCSGKNLDDLRAELCKDELCNVLFSDHAQNKPRLQQYYNADGNIVDNDNSGEPVRLAYNPSMAAQDKCNNLHGINVGNIHDSMLQTIKVSDEVGDTSKLLLNRYPNRNEHSFVGLVQLETCYQRYMVEKHAYHVACSQPNFNQKNSHHHHNGFNAMFGNHHSYRNYIAPYQTRPVTSLKVCNMQ